MENGALTSAFDKIRGGEGAAVSLLSDEEAHALAGFLSTKISETNMTEADQLLCRHIRIILQERAARLNTSASEHVFQRTNLTLRAAIDLFLAKDYAAVLQKDVDMLRDTQSRLETMVSHNESSPNHVRLSNLIGECLAAYAEWTAQQPAPPSETPTLTAPPPNEASPVASPPPAAPVDVSVAEARVFLSQAGLREGVPTIEGIALGASVRVLLHEGSLELRGEITDEFLLDVRRGSLVVEGGIFGYVVADGDITVRGSVQGGWLFSRTGSIRADRVLASSVLIAPRGNVSAGSSENPRLVYCGNDFSSDQGVRSGTYFVRNFSATDGVRNARVLLRGTMTARSIDVDANDDTAGIQFRLAHTCFDFGRPIPDGVSAGLRNFGRIRYRRRVSTALLVYLEAELLAIQRLRIFAMQSSGVDASVIAPIRSAQVEWALLAVLLELGEGLKELLVLGENIGHGMDVALINVGVDEVTAFLSIVMKEIKMLSRSFLRDKEVLEAPCRHIASFAKKLKDNLRLGQGVDKLLYDFDFRMDEWRAQVAQAALELEVHEAAMASLLGPLVWQVTDTVRLAALLARMVQAAEEAGKLPRFMQSREIVALREHAEQHTANRRSWCDNLDGLRAEYDQALAALQESIGLLVADDGEQQICAENFGPGVRVQTLATIKKISGASGAMVLVTGGAAGSPRRIRMRNLRIYPEAE